MKYLLSGISDLVLAGLFIVTWVDPLRFSDTLVKSLMLVMLMEFFAIHSGAFLGAVLLSPLGRIKKLAALTGLGAFYSLFIGSFGWRFGTLWPLGIFWLLIVNRMIEVLAGEAPDGMERTIMKRGWAAGVLFYLLSVMLTTVLPVPQLGISGSVVTLQDLTGSGLWIDQPWTVIAAGSLYFTLIGLSAMTRHRLFKSGDNQPRKVTVAGKSHSLPDKPPTN